MNRDILAAAYGRKSTDDQQGVYDQWELCARRAQADRRHIPASDAYRFGDNDSTGKTSDRKQFERLINVITGGKAPFRYLYVKDKSRFGRWLDPRQHSFYEFLFEQHGVKLIYCNQVEELDFSGGVSGSQIGFYLKDSVDNFYAAQERLEIISRTRVGKRQSLMRGSYPTHLIPYATRRVLVSKLTGEMLGEIGARVVRDRETTLVKLDWIEGEPLAAVREIFSRILKGDSMHEICADFNERRLPAPTGGAWSHKTISRLARNPVYIGDVVWGKRKSEVEPVHYAEAAVGGSEPIIYPDFIPNPPVSREDFESVQRILAGNRVDWTRRYAISQNYLLSGLVVCGECGFSFHGTTVKTTRGTKINRYYRHTRPLDQSPRARPEDRLRARSQACSDQGRYVRAELIEAHVLRLLDSILKDGIIVESVMRAIEARLGTDAKAESQKEKDRLVRTVERLERSLQRAVADSLSATSDSVRVELIEARDRLGRELDVLRESLSRHEQREQQLDHAVQGAHVAQARALRLRDVIKSGEIKHRKEALASILDRIELTLPSREEFTPNCTDNESRRRCRLVVRAF